MDGVLVDFNSGVNRLPAKTWEAYKDHPEDAPGVFALMDPYFTKRLILCHHKERLRGAYLIDDREKHGANIFPGKWIHFGSPEFPNWTAILKELDC